MAKKSAAAKNPVSLLDTLVASASPKQASEGVKKDNVQMAEDTLGRLVNEYTASAVIAKIAEDQKKADESQLKLEGFALFVTQWATKGIKPENPVLKSQHASVRLQVKGPYKVALPPDHPLTVDSVAQVLPAGTEDLSACVKVESNLTCKALDKLLTEGNDDEKEAATAALKALSGLSEKHRALVLETKPRLVVDDERLAALLANQCDNNPTLMKQVLEILVPQLALSQPKNEQAMQVAAERFNKAAAPVAKAA